MGKIILVLLVGCVSLSAQTLCDADYLIKKLNLEPLPQEGGYFYQTYKADRKIPSNAMPDHRGERAYSTAIYFLITDKSFSALHRVRTDEVFHFYLGDPVEMVQIDPQGKLHRLTLGSNVRKDQMPQAVVPMNSWQGSRLIPGGHCALLGATVAPGFEYADLEVKSRRELLKIFPMFREIVEKFTAPDGK